jgi:hypothetical protein
VDAEAIIKNRDRSTLKNDNENGARAKIAFLSLLFRFGKVSAVLFFANFSRSTRPDFKTQEDHLNTWFTDLATAALSPYGTRRLFDALKRTG